MPAFESFTVPFRRDSAVVMTGLAVPLFAGTVFLLWAAPPTQGMGWAVFDLMGIAATALLGFAAIRRWRQIARGDGGLVVDSSGIRGAALNVACVPWSDIEDFTTFALHAGKHSWRVIGIRVKNEPDYLSGMNWFDRRGVKWDRTAVHILPNDLDIDVRSLKQMLDACLRCYRDEQPYSTSDA